jgi:serine/threonine protein kinase/tetratricopeptide (TPR) repeat protein
MTEETLFQEALSRSPEEREAFLDQACAGQPQLRAAVEALLAAHARPGNLLDRPPVGPPEVKTPSTAEYPPGAYDSPPPLATTGNYSPRTEAGAQIAGRYLLAEKIGEGGMGEVWVAKQTEPVKRKVALKLIKPGMDSRAVLQRFEAERQALALMDHPNIARVLDGGLTADRRPFFVMELVNGLPLTRFCDDARLGIRGRLDVFVAICQAVQHAHQKGIIHRDLKPTNILVTLVDGKPVPKVIDFGVAKAVGGKLLDESLSTQFGAVIGTLEYMAPEQAGWSGSDIDTRADVYSLGVILYELLTGLRPLDAKRLQQAAITEMVRIIKEEEPSKPSTRISTDASAPSLAALRHTEPRGLSALLRGELDWVVMKCLEKQRDRRYETANGLARDIQRYLANEVVEARPPSAGYRLRKFVSRNKGRVVAASLLIFTMLAGIAAVVAVQVKANRELAGKNAELAEANERERQRFDLAQEAIRTFYTGVSEDLLLKQKEFGSLRGKLLRNARDFYQKLEHLLKAQSDRQSRVALGHSYRDVAQLTQEVDTLQDALTGHRRALAIFEELARENPDDPEIQRDLGRCLISVGFAIYRTDGGSTEGIAYVERARAVLESAVAARPTSNDDRALLASVQARVAEYQTTQGHLDLALNAVDQSCTNWEAVLRAGDRSEAVRFGYAEALDNRSSVLRGLNRLAEAIESLTNARRLGEELVHDFPADRRYGRELVRTLGNMGICLGEMGRFEESLASLEAARAVNRTMTEASPTLLNAQRDLLWIDATSAWILRMTARDEEAIKVLERVTAGRELLMKANPNEVQHVRMLVFALRHEAESYKTLGKLAQARARALRALTAIERTVDANPERFDLQVLLAEVQCLLGDIDIADRKPAQARAWFENALAIRQKRVDADRTDGLSIALVADALRRIGTTLEASDKPAEAVVFYRRSLASLVGLKTPQAVNLYDVACCHSLLSGAASQPASGLSAEEGRSEAELAIAGIRRAFEAGYRNLTWVRTGDPDLKPIRSRSDFQTLMKELDVQQPRKK